MQLKLFFVLLFIVNSCSKASGMSKKDSVWQSLSELKKAYENKNIDDTTYLVKVHALLRTSTASGVSFSSSEMLHNLSLFRTITWDNPQYAKYKRTYYGMLANQAQVAGRGGEIFYYAEKLNSWEKEYSKRPSLAALTLKTD